MEASKTLGKTLLFALIPLAALLIAAELATRLFIDPPYQPFIIAKSDYLPFTTPHNETCTQTIGDAAYLCEYHFNADGFRVSAGAVEPYRDKRSLYLGDSFTLGWGVTYEESYVGLLAEKMPPDRSILNAGYTAGWSPDSYYAYLVKNHSLLGIDEVKIFLNHTDVDDVRHNRWLETDDYGGPVALKTIRRLVDYRGSPIDWSVWTETASVRFLRDSAFYRLIVSWPTRGADWEMGWDPEMEPEPKPFDRLEQALRAMDAFCRDQDLRLSFVLVSERWHSGHKDYDLVMTAFRKIVASLDRPLLDLSPHLDRTSYYIPNDGHLNAAGSRVAAEAIWNHIVSEALLDP